MKTSIGIRFSVEGIHNYPTASQDFDDRVKFLEFPHRHNFGVEAVLPVYHDNRDTEFILLKRQVIEFLNEKYYNLDFAMLYFGSMSCEMIAKEIMVNFGFKMVKVDEDGENYAIVELQDEKGEALERPELKEVQVTYVFGKVCSGKTTYIKRLQDVAGRDGSTLVIDVGDIVRRLTQENGRVYDTHLDQRIGSEIVSMCRENDADHIVIIGIRQISLLEFLEDHFHSWEGICVSCHYQLINTDRKTRRIRFNSRQAIKDDGLSFDQVEEQEYDLGIDDLIIYLIDNYTNLELIQV